MELDKIKLNPNNPRFIKDEKFKSLVKSLIELPVMTELREIVVDEDNVIIGGNMRYRAAKEAGWKEIPTKVFTRAMADENNKLTNQSKTYEQYCKEIMIKDNISGGDWDWELLSSEFEKEELEDWGLDIDKWKEDDVIEDEVPEVTENPVSKLGEVYQLGRHRLMCGDSTKIEDVEKLMDGKKADISFTSPPYNAGENIRGNFYENDGDNKSDEEYTSFLVTTTLNALEYCKYNFVNLGILESNKYALIDFQTQMREYVKDILVWNKSIAPPHINPGTFSTKWEYVFAFSKDSKSRGFPCNWQGLYPNVIETENNSGNEFANEHKAGFPVAFPLWIINKMDFAKSVIDLFMGTGTTLIACEQTNRTCYGMELDPKYCDVIRKRYAKFINSEDWESATPKIL